MKSCNSCGCVLVVPTTWLSSSEKTNQYKCRTCKAAYLSSWRRRNPGAYKEHTYGLSQKEHDKMFEEQRGKCAICGTTEAGGRHNVMHIDHCHSTNKVRGLLCWSCNAGLGQFKDSIPFLKRAIMYLEKFNEN